MSKVLNDTRPSFTNAAGGVSPADRIDAWRDWFGLKSIEANVLDTLFRSAGGALTAEEVARRNLAGGFSPHRVPKHIATLKEALEPGGIAVEGIGWRLTETGLAECQAVLSRSDRRTA